MPVLDADSGERVGGIQAKRGNLSHPSYAFQADQDTGIYLSDANRLGLVAGGVEVAVISGTSLTVASGQLLLPDGTAALPATSYSAQSGVGWYRAASSDQRAAVAGVDVFRLGGSAATLRTSWPFGWASTSGDITIIDLQLFRGGTSGALRVFSGTTPTASGCGTSPTLAGNNSNGQITIGATPGTCVITFNGTWTNVPRCWLNNRTSAADNRATSNSTTSFTIAGTILASDVIDWWCVSS